MLYVVTPATTNHDRVNPSASDHSTDVPPEPTAPATSTDLSDLPRTIYCNSKFAKMTIAIVLVKMPLHSNFKDNQGIFSEQLS